MYPPELVKPMQDELENAGFTSLHSAQEVEEILKKEGNNFSCCKLSLRLCCRNCSPRSNAFIAI